MTTVYNDSENQTNSQLILCIEEKDGIQGPNSVDTRMFIGWNRGVNDFFVRGKRQDINDKEFVPYAFHCECASDLYDFIDFVVGVDENISLTLYNFNNIDEMKDCDMTYEFFEDNMDRNYEIVAYDHMQLKRSTILKCLKMLRNTYNWEENDV